MKFERKIRREQILDCVEEVSSRHFSDSEFGAQELASALALSLRHLQRLMKEEQTLSPNQYLREYRLQKAFKLCLGHRGITDIALSCGFSSSAYFTQCFKARYGYSPSQLRQCYRKHGRSKTQFFKALKKLKSEHQGSQAPNDQSRPAH